MKASNQPPQGGHVNLVLKPSHSCCGGHNQAGTNTMSPTPSEVIDPVCGMSIDPSDAAGEHVYQGQTYFFCNPGCLAKFKADPGKYLQSSARETEIPAPPGTRYVCPMDPEVQQD